MLETCRGPKFLINLIKIPSRWFHYTEVKSLLAVHVRLCNNSTANSLYIQLADWVSRHSLLLVMTAYWVQIFLTSSTQTEKYFTNKALRHSIVEGLNCKKCFSYTRCIPQQNFVLLPKYGSSQNYPGPIGLLLALNIPGGKKLAHTKLKKKMQACLVATRLCLICGQIRIKEETFKESVQLFGLSHVYGNLFICCLFCDGVEGRKKFKDEKRK
jgi:hypothetical protein